MLLIKTFENILFGSFHKFDINILLKTYFLL